MRHANQHTRHVGAGLTVAAALAAGALAAEPPAAPATAATSRLITYDAPAGIAASPYDRVAVNGRPVFVYPCQVGTVADDDGKLIPDRHKVERPSPAALCSFDFSGKVEVEVTVLGPAWRLPLRGAVLRPLRHGVAVAKEQVVNGEHRRIGLRARHLSQSRHWSSPLVGGRRRD